VADGGIVLRARADVETALVSLPRRLKHVQCVASVAAGLPLSAAERENVLTAAWLHDIGYAPGWAVTGFHPVDGARRLRQLAWPDEVVSLVAYHSGAEWEAQERGLTTALEEFDRPPDRLLDFVTFADMTSSPDGERVSVEDRVAEILSRYPEGEPVHRAVTLSAPYLTAAARRTIKILALPDKGF